MCVETLLETVFSLIQVELQSEVCCVDAHLFKRKSVNLAVVQVITAMMSIVSLLCEKQVLFDFGNYLEIYIFTSTCNVCVVIPTQDFKGKKIFFSNNDFYSYLSLSAKGKYILYVTLI